LLLQRLPWGFLSAAHNQNVAVHPYVEETLLLLLVVLE
jgi:hypothetical protein